MANETIDFGDGQIPKQSLDNTEKPEIERVLDTYIEVYKGFPWKQDLSDERENIKSNWINTNASIQPIEDDQTNNIVAFHIFHHDEYSKIEETLTNEYLHIASLPVGDSVADVSNIDISTIKKNLSEEFSGINVYYLRDLGILENERTGSNRLKMMLSILGCLKNSDYAMGNTLNYGPLFDIVDGLKSFKIHHEISIPDTEKKHILFSVKSEDVIRDKNMSRIDENYESLIKRFKINTKIDGGTLQDTN